MAEDAQDILPDDGDAKLYDILVRNGMDGRDAHMLINEIGEMASTNLIHRFENKLDAVRTELGARLDAQASQFKLLLWFIGVGVGILIALNVIAAF